MDVKRNALLKDVCNNVKLIELFFMNDCVLLDLFIGLLCCLGLVRQIKGHQGSHSSCVTKCAVTLLDKNT